MLAVYDRLFQLGHKDFLAYGQRVLMIKRDLGMELTRRFPEQPREAPARRSSCACNSSDRKGTLGYISQSASGSMAARCAGWSIWQSNDRRRVTVIALLDGTNNHVRELVFFAGI